MGRMYDRPFKIARPMGGELTTNRVDIPVGIAKAPGGRMQRDQPFSAFHKLPKGVFLIRCQVIMIGINYKTVIFVKVLGIQVAKFLGIRNIDAARKECRGQPGSIFSGWVMIAGMPQEKDFRPSGGYLVPAGYSFLFALGCGYMGFFCAGNKKDS